MDPVAVDIEHLLITPDVEEDLTFFHHHDDFSSSGTVDGDTSLSIGDIEKFLFTDDFEDHQQPPVSAHDADAFLSDILVASPQPSSSSHDVALLDSTNNAKDSSASDSENKPHEQSDDHSNQIDHIDPIAKKRKRQLRNRDAAVRSRERKKIYVRDLEMKSRYYEAECRRLGMLLQCSLAENHALKFSLHNSGQAFAASTTKQESAVLLLESLLLGSLLWFLGILGLLILPRLLLSPLAKVGEKNQASLAARKAGSNMFGNLVFLSLMKSKRWKGSRTRMKEFGEWLYDPRNISFFIIISMVWY